MIWQTHIKTADSAEALPEELEVANVTENPVRVGAAMFGWIYRGNSGRSWYRVLPMDQVALEWRHGLKSAQPDDGSMRMPKRDWQQHVSGTACLVLSYELDLPCKSLSEIFDELSAAERLTCLINLLGRLPAWWNARTAPLYPMPADLLFDADFQPRLLGTPTGLEMHPRLLESAPERLLFLPPEWFLSPVQFHWDQPQWEAVDCYGVGVLLLGSLFRWPEIRHLNWTATSSICGTLFADLSQRDDVPFWLKRFSRFERTVIAIRQLTARSAKTRTAQALPALVGQLEKLLELFDPYTAAIWLRDVSRSQEALALLEDLFPSAESLRLTPQQLYRLYCLAADLNARFHSRPLDAIDYYERAIQLDGSQTQAYREELQVIAGIRHHLALNAMLKHDPAIAEDVDQKLWRNYKAAFGTRTTHATNDGDARIDRLVADYLLFRERYAEAQEFIVSRLFDEQKHYIWWDFDLMLAYVQALVGLDQGDGENLRLARQQLDQVKDGLRRVASNRSVSPETVHQVGAAVTEMELRIANLLSSNK